MNNQQVWAVVPAAGVGARMLASRPKQYLSLDGRTVLEHTLQCLASHPRIKGIVLAIADDDPYWPTLNQQYDCVIHCVSGGNERADSVLNSLQYLAELTEDDPWVLVHDAARPCLRHSDIDKLLDSLFEHPIGGILGVRITETVKRSDPQQQIIETVVRDDLWRASTPQMFHLHALQEAISTAKKDNKIVTDEASAIALMGWQAMMVEGHADNIKITLPDDLALADLFLQQQRAEK